MSAERNSAAAPTTGLGPLLGHYGKSELHQFGNILGIGLLVLFLAYVGLTKLGVNNGLACSVSAVAAAIGAVCAMGLSRRMGPIEANLYENGFAYHDHSGWVQVRWNQISELEHRVDEHEEGITSAYVVHTDAGEKIVLTDALNSVTDLVAAIEANSAKGALTDLMAEIVSGRTIAFGPFLLNARALHYDPDETQGRLLPYGGGPVTLSHQELLKVLGNSSRVKSIGWDQILSLEQSPRREQPSLKEIIIKQKQPSAFGGYVWARHTEHEIANWHILTALCRHMVEASATRSVKES